MTDTPEAVMEGLRVNNERPYGRQRTVAAEELLAAADQFDDRGLQVTALLELMEAYAYDAQPRKSPVVFARVLKAWDEEPDAFDEWEAGQVLWRFKWVAAALLRVPDVPLDAVRQWHDEMRGRFTAAGQGLQPYYGVRHDLAAHTGRDAADAFDLWATRPRTEQSDCPACEVRQQALHHVLAGDDERALRAWRPVLEGRGTCSLEPHTSQAHALLPLLRCGRPDDARSAHLAGYRRSRGTSRAGEETGLHLEFCALTRNEGRGLEILAENRELFEGSSDPLAHLGFLTGVELLLSRLDADGHAELSVSGPPGTGWTAGTLLERVRGEASGLAERFDARNGTAAVSSRRLARLAQEPLVGEALALGLRAALVAGAAAGSVAGSVAGAVEGSAGSVAGPVASEGVEIPEDFSELVERARELADAGHPGGAALWTRIGERLDAGAAVDEATGTLPRLRAEVARQRAMELWEDEAWTAGQAAMAEAVALFEAEGLAGAALGSRARSAAVGCRSDDAEVRAAARAELADVVRRAGELRRGGGEEIGDDDYALVMNCWATVAHHDLTEGAGAPEDAGEAAPEAERTPGDPDDPTPPPARTPVPPGATAPGAGERFHVAVHALLDAATERGVVHRRATALSMIGHVAARDGRLDEAEGLLREALALLEAAQQPWRAVRLLLLLAQVRLSQERPHEVVDLVHQALAGAARWGERGFPYGPARALLGHARMQTGDPEGAARALTDALAWYDRRGPEADAAQTRLQLAGALDAAGRPGDAVAVLESLLAGPVDGLPERLLAQARHSLGRGLRGLGEHRAAAEEFLRLADAVSGWADQDVHTMVACDATSALAAAGLADAAAEACERALAAHRGAPRPDQVITMLCDLAKAAVDASGPDGLDRALELLATADAVHEEALRTDTHVHSWYQSGAIGYRRGCAYAMAGRPEDALTELERAVTAYEQGGRDGEEPRAEAIRVAALVEGDALDRPAAARARLAPAIRRCEEAGLPEAASILASLRDRMG